MTTAIQPDTAEVIVLMDEAEAAAITQEIRDTTTLVCHLVKEAHDKQAWRALGYPTWAAYCKAEFNIGRSRSYQLVRYAEAIALTATAAGLPESTIVDFLPEGETRGLNMDEVAELVTEVIRDLPPDASISTRGDLIKAVVGQIKADAADISDEEPPPPAPASDAPGQDPAPVPVHPSPQEAGAGTPPDAAAQGDTGAMPGGGGEGAADDEAAAPSASLSPDLARAAEREAVAADMVAARRLLDRDPAEVAGLMSTEDTATWCAHADDMADWSHRFETAVKDNHKLRSVQ